MSIDGILMSHHCIVLPRLRESKPSLLQFKSFIELKIDITQIQRVLVIIKLVLASFSKSEQSLTECYRVVKELTGSFSSSFMLMIELRQSNAS